MDPFASEADRPGAVPPILISPISTARAPASPSSSPDPEPGRLRSAAALDASLWQLSNKAEPCRLLKRRWREASSAIAQALDRIRAFARGGRALDPESQWLVDNARLLRTALEEARESLEALRSLPQIKTEHGHNLPRVYAAAQAFLPTVGFRFHEELLLAYFGALEQSHPFKVGELWSVRPMLELVLLEQVGGVAAALPRGLEQSGHPEKVSPQPSMSLADLVSSLREIGRTDWKELFEQLSEVDRILAQDPSGTYPTMDFESRNRYRGAVEHLALHSRVDEFGVARKAIALARAAKNLASAGSRAHQRRSHVGFYLMDRGKGLLEREIDYRPPFREQIEELVLDWPEVFYFVGVELVTLGIIAFLLNGLGAALPLLVGISILLLPATESAVGVMNQLVAFLLRPRVLPKLDFSEGIPAEFTTIVVVPTLLIGENQVRQVVRDLEIRYLANSDANLHFALLTDSPDSSQPLDEPDELVGLCRQLINDLNDKYLGEGQGSFFLFHRHRRYNPSERTWMGWERKRGKLIDFNNLLRQTDDSFSVKIGDLSRLPEVRYVITLDSDTQLPRGAAHRLIGTLAHPLNRAVIDPVTNTVVEGYGILQPRVAISVQSTSRSRLANVYSGQTGFDIYTRAISNVYQDLFGEGSFTGKGIYEVDTFQRVLAQRFPSNAILSHDLIEGTYARAGLVSDVEVIDDYPSHFSAYSRRKHRWVRGDWQIMLWLLPRVPDFSGAMVPNPLGVISRWKILDNLRRSLTEIATFVLLLAGWFFLPGGSLRWTLATLVLMLIPTYLQLALSALKVRRAENLVGFLKETGEAFATGQLNVFLLLTFLSHQVLVMLDAIGRTLIRLTITRRKLLEWETAAQAELGSAKKTPVDLYLEWTPYLSLGITLLLAVGSPAALPVALPFLLMWAFTPALSRWLNKPLREGRREITDQDEAMLRGAALRTWRFFRQFSNSETNWCIPDNVQQTPSATLPNLSPTNLGLLLNARLAAYQLGYLTVTEFVDLTEKTFAALRRMPRYQGHLFNWYDTRTLKPLDPHFVSTVDSGNLACCLWTLKHGCLRAAEGPIFRKVTRQGLRDHLALLGELADARPGREAFRRALTAFAAPLAEDTSRWLDELSRFEEAAGELAPLAPVTGEKPSDEFAWWIVETRERLREVRGLAESLAPWLLPEYSAVARDPQLQLDLTAEHLTLASMPEFVASLDQKLEKLSQAEPTGFVARRLITSLRERLPACLGLAERLSARLRALAEGADTLVAEMDFGFLYDRRRKVLSVGYDLARGRVESSCYELLASEARTAVFIAIAKANVPQESWFHLGRAHTAYRGERVLLSWSGTLFEYLMPALWVRNYPNTILERSLRSVVRCQQKVARRLKVPWGISEAAYSHTDDEGRYHYEAFGVPSLALKPNLPREAVVAPYATFLALRLDPRRALENLRAMKRMGWLGEFGFYESADFGPSRVSEPHPYKLVRCWMAHHQGMTLLSVCNFLCDSGMEEFFHAEARVAATERLLHERLPLTIPVERSNDRESDPLRVVQPHADSPSPHACLPDLLSGGQRRA